MKLALLVFPAVLALPPRDARAEGPATQLLCKPDWVGPVYRERRSAVAVVERAGGVGSGFLFGSPRLVVTALHVVDDGRPVTVTFPGTDPEPAEVVAVDGEHDLAILRLERDVPGAVPLAPSRLRASVGDPVLVLGHPYGGAVYTQKWTRGLLRWSATQGIVSVTSTDFIQVDVSVNPGNSGGPLLDCEGNVLGVIDRIAGLGLGVAVRGDHIAALLGELEKGARRYHGKWRLDSSAIMPAAALDAHRAWIGLYVEAVVLGYDRLASVVRTGVLFWAGKTDGEELWRKGTRLQVELVESYRWLLPWSHYARYFALGAGALLDAERIDVETVELTPDNPRCDPSVVACPSHIEINETSNKTHEVRPLVTASLIGPTYELVYEWQIDMHGLGNSTHLLALGLRF